MEHFWGRFHLKIKTIDRLDHPFNWLPCEVIHFPKLYLKACIIGEEDWNYFSHLTKGIDSEMQSTENSLLFMNRDAVWSHAFTKLNLIYSLSIFLFPTYIIPHRPRFLPLRSILQSCVWVCEYVRVYNTRQSRKQRKNASKIDRSRGGEAHHSFLRGCCCRCQASPVHCFVLSVHNTTGLLVHRWSASNQRRHVECMLYSSSAPAQRKANRHLAPCL